MEESSEPEGSFDDDNFALPDEMYYQPGGYKPRPSVNVAKQSGILNNLVINKDKNEVVEVSSSDSETQ